VVPRWRRSLLPTLLCLPAFGLMLAGLGEPLHGEHVFRQTHVAGNIEKFLAHGLSLRPETYNQDVPGALFDFPLYPWIVAAICRVSGSPPVPAARVVNMAILALTLVTLAGLWRRTGASPVQRLFGLVFFAYAPLTLFYFQVPLPDPLALLFGLASVAAYWRWDRAPTGPARSRALAGLIVFGTLSTLIKNPLYMPFAIGILWDRLRRRGPAGLLAAGMLAFLAALLVAVAGFKLYANHVNEIGSFLASGENQAFFGSLHDRTRPKFWRQIAASFTTRVVVAPIFWLSVLGLLLYVWRARARGRALHLGLALGSAATLLVFFSRHHEHHYYQIPFVPVLAFFAAYPPGLLATWLRSRARASALWLWAGPLLGAALLAMTASDGLAAFREMSANWDAGLLERGRWLASQTTPDDFVVFVLGWREDNWEPSHLYFARRDGVNLARQRVAYADLAALHRQFAGRTRRFLVFTPAQGQGDVDAPLQALGARVLADDPGIGRLYRLEPAWLRPID